MPEPLSKTSVHTSTSRDELRELTLVREALEAVLTPQLASRLLYLALVEFGLEPPSNATDLGRFIHDALTPVLSEHLDEGRASEIVSSIRQVVRDRPRVVSRGSAITLPPPGFGVEGETTEELPMLTPLLHVAVFAASASLARRLATTFGGRRVECAPLIDIGDFRRLTQSPNAQILIIDATDLTQASPESLAQALGDLERRVLRVVWGADLPFGRRVKQHLPETDDQVIHLRCDDGIEPLLDLIRARTTPGRAR